MWTPEQEAQELARAELWRAQAQRRLAFQSWLWFSALAGDAAARYALAQRWAAIVLWLAESQLQETDPCDDPSFDPLHIADSVNVGT